MNRNPMTEAGIQTADRLLSAACASLAAREARDFLKSPSCRPSEALDRRIAALTGKKMTGKTHTAQRKRTGRMALLLCAALFLVTMTAAAVPAVRNAVAERLEKLSRHFSGFTEEDLLPGGELYFTPLPEQTADAVGTEETTESAFSEGKTGTTESAVTPETAGTTETASSGETAGTTETASSGETAEIAERAEISEPAEPYPEITDPKLYIYDRLLNSLHYYDAVTLKFSYPGGAVTCALDWENGLLSSVETPHAEDSTAESSAAENSTDRTVQNTILCDGYTLLTIDGNGQSYSFDYSLARRDTIRYTDPASVVSVNESDGMTEYNGHGSVHGLPSSYAAYALDPENFAFRFLKDFTRWEITEECTYLDRTCVRVTGQLDRYESSRMGAETFTMLIEKESGILMLLTVGEGSAEKEISRVSEISFDRAAIPTREDLCKTLNKRYGEIAPNGTEVSRGVQEGFWYAARPAQEALHVPDLREIAVYDAEMTVGEDRDLRNLTLVVGDPAGTGAGILEITPSPLGWEGSFTPCAVPERAPDWMDFRYYHGLLLPFLAEHPCPAGTCDAAEYLMQNMALLE